MLIIVSVLTTYIFLDDTPHHVIKLQIDLFIQNSHTQHTKQDKIGYMFWLIKRLSGPY
jgi:hypothetical protein